MTNFGGERQRRCMEMHGGHERRYSTKPGIERVQACTR